MKPNIAVITGAGRGIGRAVAIELGRKGYDLLLTAKTKKELEESAKLAGRAEILVGDVSSLKHVKRLIDKAKSLGQVRVIVNNAGYAPAGLMQEISIDDWQKMLAVNLSAVFYMCKCAWPIMVKQNAGVIVNISSVASRDPFPGLGPYGAAKAALNLLGLDLARQGKAHGIRVHTIAPGAVETGMLRKLVTKKQLPVEQTLTPEDVAQAVYACIDGALSHTSGEVVYLQK